MAAVTAKFKLRGIDIIALGARVFKSGATVTAILDTFRVLKLAFWAIHIFIPKLPRLLWPVSETHRPHILQKAVQLLRYIFWLQRFFL